MTPDEILAYMQATRLPGSARPADFDWDKYARAYPERTVRRWPPGYVSAMQQSILQGVGTGDYKCKVCGWRYNLGETGPDDAATERACHWCELAGAAMRERLVREVKAATAQRVAFNRSANRVALAIVVLVVLVLFIGWGT